MQLDSGQCGAVGQENEKGQKLAAPWSSQAVPHHSTNQALGCLTSEVGRDLVLSTRYGRQRHERAKNASSSKDGKGQGGKA